MGSPTILPELGTEILVPVCGVVGIIFSLIQWGIVSRVKVTHERTPSSSNKKNGFNDYLIEEEEGINDQSVVAKCAEIQNAISEGEVLVWVGDLRVSVLDLVVHLCLFSDLFV